MSGIANQIAPLILIIIFGAVSGRSGLLPEGLRGGLSDFCYYFGMPALLIRTIATAPPSSVPVHLVWSAYLIPIAVVWLAATLLNARRGGASIPMASAYGNVIMLGVPLVLQQFGPAAAMPVSLIVLVHSPALFLAAAVHSELSKGTLSNQALSLSTVTAATPGETRIYQICTGLGRALRECCVDLASNPIILAIAAGAVLRLANVGLTPIADAALAAVGQATLPCVLLALGLGLSKLDLRGELATAIAISALKLLVMPACTWYVAAKLLQMPPLEVAVVTLLSAMPTGANAFVFACREKSAEASVSAAVTLSTVLSALTVTIVLSVLTV